MDFVVKPLSALTAEDFEMTPLWAGYYEPDDIGAIVEYGFRLDEVVAAFDAAGWEDDHQFPLPLEAADSEWMRGKLFGTMLFTPGGTRLQGYTNERRTLTVFHAGRGYLLLRDLPEHTRRTALELAAALGEPTLLPLAVINRVTGQAWTFTL